MNIRNTLLSAFSVTALAFLTLAPPADAGLVTAVNSRAALGGNDFVDWGDLGPEFTTASNPFSIASNLGYSTTVSKPSLGDFERDDEGGFGWTGNFSPGDALLWTALTPGPITIDLGVSGFGGGVQIQNDFLGAFVATVQAFDAIGNSLGVFNFNGNSNQAGDGSAIFVGIKSTDPEIRKLTFNVQGSTSFAINQLDTAVPVLIPEVSTVAFGWGCALLLTARRRRRSVIAGTK